MERRLVLLFAIMHFDSTNLLPPKRARSFRLAYFLRLANLSMLLAGILLLAHAVLLVPTHTFLASQIKDRTQALETLSQSDVSSSEAAFETRLTALSASAKRIQDLGTLSSGSGTFSKILAIPRSGIALSALIFTAPTSKKVGTVAITGVAASRDSLRAYQSAFQGAPFVTAADLPVSAYASDSAIHFTITLSLVAP